MGTLVDLTPMFRVWCAHHQCDLEEIEHYDDWLYYGDMSGFLCPKAVDADGNFIEEEDAKCEWAVSPVGNPDLNLLNLVPSCCVYHRTGGDPKNSCGGDHA